MVKDGLAEKVAFEKISEGGAGVSHIGLWGKSILGRGSSVMTMSTEHAQHVREIVRRCGCLEQDLRGGEVREVKRRRLVSDHFLWLLL